MGDAFYRSTTIMSLVHKYLNHLTRRLVDSPGQLARQILYLYISLLETQFLSKVPFNLHIYWAFRIALDRNDDIISNDCSDHRYPSVAVKLWILNPKPA